MSKLTLNDEKVFLEDLLLGGRRAKLDAVTEAAGYAPVLERTLTKIQALPPALVGGEPNAEELAAADLRHDGIGLALFYLGKAVLAHPDSTSEQKEAARFIHQKVVPSRAQLRASFATEAARATERRPVVEGGRSILERITIFATNAYQWATSFLDAGSVIAQLLSGRADTKVESSRSVASILRTRALAQIHTLREIVADAHADDPERARLVDAQLFAFLDLLEDMRDRGSKDPTPVPPPLPDAPA